MTGRKAVASVPADREVVPVVEERAQVRTRRELTEGLRVRTLVREHEETVDTTLTTEVVEIERRPLDQWVEAAVPIRQEGETTIITTIEEVVVVEKRLRAIEEIRLTRRRTTRQASQPVTLRREEAIVERLEAAGPDDEPG